MNGPKEKILSPIYTTKILCTMCEMLLHTDVSDTFCMEKMGRIFWSKFDSVGGANEILRPVYTKKAFCYNLQMLLHKEVCHSV